MEIFKEAQKNFDYMVRIRRHMHEYPEMTGQEFKTLEFIKKELDALGIEYVEVPDGGIVGQIHGGKPGKTVLMRADMEFMLRQAVRVKERRHFPCLRPRFPYGHAAGRGQDLKRAQG